MPDEHDTRHGLRIVTPLPPLGAHRGGQEADLLLEADRRDLDARQLGEPAYSCTIHEPMPLVPSALEVVGLRERFEDAGAHKSMAEGDEAGRGGVASAPDVEPVGWGGIAGLKRTLTGRASARRGRSVPLWAKVAIALHFIVIVAGVNFFAPGSKFQTVSTLDQQVAAIASGFKPTPRANERALRVAFLTLLKTPRDTLAWGSSRALAINSDVAGKQDFLNVAASYGTLFDLAALFSIFQRTDSWPRTLIVSPDAWMLNLNVQTSAWNDYGSDVERGLNLVGMSGPFASKMQGFEAKIKLWGDDFAQITSPALFRNYLVEMRARIRESGLAKVFGNIQTRPIDYERDGWDRDLSYWYPCIPINEVRDRALRWGTDRANPGELLLDGRFTELDPALTELFRTLLASFKARGVQLFMFLSPLHPLSYADMASTPARRLTIQAEDVFRALARDLNIPVFGSNDPAKAGLTEADFCTDALHIRPDVMRRVFEFTGLRQALAK